MINVWKRTYILCLPPNATHLCQPLDVAVFRTAKSEWRDILDTWHKESRSKENLPKTVLPTLLSELMTRLKSSNLIAGFRASGIHPINRNEVLKRIPSSNQAEDVNLQVLNDSVLQVLEENCGVGKQTKSMNKKRGRKIKPGERIVDLENQNSKKKKKLSPVKTKAANYIGESEDEEEEWRCYDCKEVWDESGDDRWVVCDMRNLKFHLQCYGISYDIEQYWNITLELPYLECEICQEAEVDN